MTPFGRWVFAWAAIIATVVFFGFSPAHSQEYYMSREETIQAQTMLLEHGFIKVGYPDGDFGPKTREAISQYQMQMGWPQTGYLTEEQFQKLIVSTPPPALWGGVSASADGKFNSVWNYSSGLEAYRDARQGCPGKCTTIVTYDVGENDEGWVAAVHCDKRIGRTEHFQVAVASRITRNEAVEGAYEQAMAEGYTRSQCNLLTVVAADGSHK